MINFWVMSGALAALAVLFVAFPALKFKQQQARSTNDAAHSRQLQNIEIFKDRLSELDTDLKAERLSQSEYNELKEELELSLLTDVDDNTADDTEVKVQIEDSGRSVLWSGVLAVIVIACSYALYFQWGSYEQVQQREAMNFDSHERQQVEEAVQQGDMDSLLQQLYDKLQASPDNIEGWMLFARTAMKMEYFDKAAEGFKAVIESVERNQGNAAPFYGLLAQAYYFGQSGLTPEGEMSEQVKATLDKALSIDPNDSNAIGLFALHAFDSKDYEGAIAYWQRMLKASPDHPARESIESGIARAQSLLGIQPESSNESQDAEPLASESVSAEIIVSVSLDDALKEQVNPDDFVFIFARSETGPPVPLAASRHRVSELPLTIRLDDSKAMAPMAKLSNVEVANVVARVSKSGEPMAQAGDFEGRLTGIPVNEQKKVSIVIDTQL